MRSWRSCHNSFSYWGMQKSRLYSLPGARASPYLTFLAGRVGGAKKGKCQEKATARNVHKLEPQWRRETPTVPTGKVIVARRHCETKKAQDRAHSCYLEGLHLSPTSGEKIIMRSWRCCHNSFSYWGMQKSRLYSLPGARASPEDRAQGVVEGTDARAAHGPGPATEG